MLKINSFGSNPLGAQADSASWSSAMRVVICLILIALMWIPCGCRRQNDKPDIVLIVVDALRADRLEPSTMPGLSALAESGFVFDLAIAQAPWTAPSIASLMTGLVSSAHGVVSHYELNPHEQSMTILDDSLYTMAEAFLDADYQTCAIVSNYWLAPQFGYDQGFENYVLSKKKMATELNVVARDWYEFTTPDRPRFLYIHYMDTHGPYQPPAEFVDRFESRYDSRELTKQEYDKLDYLAVGPYSDPASRDLATYQRLYDGAAAYADSAITELIQEIRKKNASTIIIVTSDHGEAFFEHGYPDHGYTLHDELIRVPLFIILPEFSSPPRRVPEQIELVDLFPTLLGLTGLELPSYPISGQDLTPLMVARSDWQNHRPASSLCAIRGPFRTAARLPHLKIIREIQGDDEYLDRVYDLKNDPTESQQLADDESGLRAEAVEMLHRITSRDVNTGPTGLESGQIKIEDSVLESLKALGYVQ